MAALSSTTHFPSTTPSSNSFDPLLQIITDIYDPSLVETQKIARRKALAKQISENPSVKDGFKSRLDALRAAINTFQVAREKIDDNLSKIDPNTRVIQLIEHLSLFQNSSSVNQDVIQLQNLMICIDQEGEYLEKIGTFVKAHEESFKIKFEHYKWLLQNNGKVKITDQGNFPIFQENNLDKDEALAASIFFGLSLEELQERVLIGGDNLSKTQEDVLTRGDRSKKEIQKLIDCPIKKIHQFGKLLKLHSQKLKSSTLENRAHKDLMDIVDDFIVNLEIRIQDATTIRLRDHKVFGLVLPRLNSIAKTCIDFRRESYSLYISIADATKPLWFAEPFVRSVKKILSDENMKRLIADQLVFKQMLKEHARTRLNKIRASNSRLLNSQTLKFLLGLIKDGKPKTMQEVAPLAPKAKSSSKPKKIKHLKKVASSPVVARSFDLPESKEDKKSAMENSSNLPALAASSRTNPITIDEYETEESNDEESQTAIPATIASSSHPVAVIDDDNQAWTLEKSFTYHTRVKRWNFELQRTGTDYERIPFEEYAHSTEAPLHAYIKHSFPIEIDEFIYNENYVLKDSLDGRLRSHLMARITYADGSFEDGLITYAFVYKAGRKPVCIHRCFSSQPQGDIIDPNKKAVFERITSEIETPTDLEELATEATETSHQLGSVRSKLNPEFGFIRFDIPKYDVAITIFRHTLSIKA